MKAFSVICAAAIAQAEAFPVVKAGSYGPFVPEGFEMQEFVFGMHLGFFKNFIKI